MKIGLGIFLEEDEHIVDVFRRPLIFLFGKKLRHLLIFGGIAAAGWFFYGHYLYGSGYDLRWLWVLFLGFMAYRMICEFLHWYVNVIIMTNEGLIFVRWEKLFHRHASKIEYTNLDEVEIEKHGLAPFFVNYATLVFGKIGGGEPVVFKGINRPGKVARIIAEYKENFLSKKNFTDESALKDLLTSLAINESKKGEKTELSREEIEEIIARNQRTPEKAESLEIIHHQQTEKPPKKSRFFSSVDENSDDITVDIELEKKLDDTGGLSIDLEK